MVQHHLSTYMHTFRDPTQSEKDDNSRGDLEERETFMRSLKIYCSHT